MYSKGLVAEVSQFLFGDGFAVACGKHWRVRRKAVSPALHRWDVSLSSSPGKTFGIESNADQDCPPKTHFAGVLSNLVVAFISLQSVYSVEDNLIWLEYPTGTFP